ncbi:hypothetical protein [Burkholderia contaminans]|uniref:hypothetical protein n=1 Tax=Burkholderia contaminans TaxID=488447 RepID=UPI0015825242|nr:hypothetical protein [Burkholderia contaminans]
MKTRVDSREDHLPNPGGKTGPGGRGHVMRVRHACRDGRPGVARRPHADRPGMPINRMETGAIIHALRQSACAFRSANLSLSREKK